MDRNLIRNILIAGAITSMAFGAMYVVRRFKEVADLENEDVVSPRSNANYTTPTPTKRDPEPETFIPVSVEIVQDYEDKDDDDEEKEEGEEGSVA